MQFKISGYHDLSCNSNFRYGITVKTAPEGGVAAANSKVKVKASVINTRLVPLKIRSVYIYIYIENLTNFNRYSGQGSLLIQVHPKKAYIREIKMYQHGKGRFRTHAGHGMRVVSVLLGAVAVAGVGSKPTFAKLVHLYFSNIYIRYDHCISYGRRVTYLLRFTLTDTWTEKWTDENLHSYHRTKQVQQKVLSPRLIAKF